MPDETDSNQPPQLPQPPTTPEQHPTGGAYSQGEKISKINVADEIKNSFLDYSMSVIISRALARRARRVEALAAPHFYAMDESLPVPGAQAHQVRQDLR
jgi:hypothetical protein